MASVQICLVFLILYVVGSVSDDKSNCQRKCGEIDVPYPFGMGDDEKCYKDSNFNLTCNLDITPPLIHGLNIAVFDIKFQFFLFAAQMMTQSMPTFGLDYSTVHLFGIISYSVGNIFGTGCVSLCTNDSTIIHDPTEFRLETAKCLGIGCCQTPIPDRLNGINISLFSVSHNDKLRHPCDYGFLLGTNYTVRKSSKGPMVSQVVLDWAIGGNSCEVAAKSGDPKDFICGLNTNCINSTSGPGYRCSCKDGFQGNPYTKCVDINECLLGCPCKGSCRNTSGNYTCYCSFGYHGDGKVGCHLKPIVKIIPVAGACLLLATLSLALWLMYKRMVKERNERRNGGRLLNCLDVQIYKLEELEKATNNFDKGRIIGEGGNGCVFKGLKGDRDIAVKTSKLVDQTQLEQFLHEVNVVSKVRHGNVVRLLGVCLESKAPILVYEYISNGTLYDHIHKMKSTILNSWPICLNIIAQTARALRYMHNESNPPVIHRDIKSSNILLDATNTAKISDFGASKLIPLNQTIALTRAQGTLGYLDPEYLQTSELTPKSDVYSFGVVVMELLTKMKPINLEKPEAVSIVDIFRSAVENDLLSQLLNVGNISEQETEQVQAVAKLAVKCVAMPRKDRPTMEEVVKVLNELAQDVTEIVVSIVKDQQEDQFGKTTLHFDTV
ncbi:hypothetical protein ACHQM5_006241 [Ranunculus cassubicifolius]